MNTQAKLLLPGVALVSAAVMCVAHPGHPPIDPPAVSFTGATPLPFEFFRDQRIFIQGTVNGRPSPIMVDSGAGMTVVDTAYARKLGLPSGFKMQVQGTGGPADAELVTGVNLTAGSLHLDKLTVLVTDMSSVAKSIGRPVSVILGREAFKGGAVTVDFPRHTITFADPKTLAMAGEARIPLGERGTAITVPVSIAGAAPIDADLDLGNAGNVMISNEYWNAEAALGALRHAETQVGGVGGLKGARAVTLSDVELGGHHFANVAASMNEDPQSLPKAGANVGIGLLKPFGATFDFADHALYLKGPAAVRDLPRDRAGVRTELDGDHLNVVYVSPDGPGNAAGLKVGDSIIAVSGGKVGPDLYSRADWTRGPAGTNVVLTRADGSKVTVKLADYY